MNAMNTTPATIKSIAFCDLVISDMNPRDLVNEEGIAQLAENIRKVGLIQNLGGYRSGKGKIEIVAGGRRLRALARLQDDPAFQMVPVNVTSDKAQALIWATSENSQREALHPADEVRDYGNLAKNGTSIPEIALAYGVTEKHVYRRLALADLPTSVLDALKADQLNLSAASAFTLSNEQGRVEEVLTAYLETVERGYGIMSEAQIKRALLPCAVKSDDRRATFVTLDAYVAAGGQTTQDLFADTVHLTDIELLEDMFTKKLADVAQAAKSKMGCAWAEPFDGSHLPWDFIDEMKFARVYREEGVLTDAQSEEYDELDQLRFDADLTKKQITKLDALAAIAKGEFSTSQLCYSGIVVLVDNNGEIEIAEGLVRQQDQATAIEAGVLEASKHKAVNETPKSPISSALATDLGRIVTGSRQNMLLDDPKLTLHLLAFQLCGKSGYQSTFGISTTHVPNDPTTVTGFVLDKRLAPTETDYEGGSFGKLDAAFTKFRKLGDARIMKMLNVALSQKMDLPDDIGIAFDTLTGRKTRDHFTPTVENLFTRLKGPYLCTVWNEVLGLDADHPTATNFAKKKKGEKVEALDSLFNDTKYQTAMGLDEAQLTRIATWLPEGMV